MLKLFLRNIKKGFATNSSSYHSTMIFTKEEYDKWRNGTAVKDDYGDDVTYDEWYDTDMETDTTHYTTPNGEEIIILCKYGYDG